MTQNNDREAIKKFLEWFQKSRWTDINPYWQNVDTDKNISTDELLDLYESETRIYTIVQVWDEVKTDDCDRWETWIEEYQKMLTAFAERYHELKMQNRIKQ